jgi:penicillin-binding protein 2
VPRPPRRDREIFEQVEAEARLAATRPQSIANDAITPRPEANPLAPPPVEPVTGAPPPPPAPASAGAAGAPAGSTAPAGAAPTGSLPEASVP